MRIEAPRPEPALRARASFSSTPHPRRGRVRLARLGEAAAVLALAAFLVQWRLRAADEAAGVVRIADDRVAVVTNLWTGARRSVLTPGYEVVLPRLETVHALDKSAVQYVMEGERRHDPNHVPRLVVRANDGSAFWFERVSIQYGLDLRQLPVVLQDSGPGAGFRNGLVDAFARAVLLDELGRFGPKDAVSPENLQAAGVRARERLNALLAQHGLEVYEVALSKPSFDERYEATIERREVALQEIQSLEQQASLMRKAQPSLLEETEGKQKLELEKARAKWAQQLAELESEGDRLRAGRPEELAQLEEHKRFALEKERAQWTRELDAARAEAAELEARLAQRTARMDREHELALAEQRAEHARELADVELEQASLRARHDERVAALRRTKELEREAQRAELALRLDTARAASLRVAFDAESHAAEHAVAAQAAREELAAAAAELETRARREHAVFLARAEAFATQGPMAVRAALVERLSSILFEIAPSATPTDATPTAPRKAATRVAAKPNEGAR